MKELIAKKYVKALLEGVDSKKANLYYNELFEISKAFNEHKLISIITSPEVSKDKKTELFLSFVKKGDDRLKNLIKLLGENSRLDIIPHIVKELKRELNKINNQYEGVVYVKEELDKKSIKELENQFSKKFDTNLKLSQVVCDYDGIKVDIEDLGVEVSFSAQRLRSALSEYILKAI